MNIDANLKGQALVQISNILQGKFNDSEREELGLVVNIKYSDLPGKDAKGRCISFVQQMDNEGRLDQLIDEIERRRPYLNKQIKKIRSQIDTTYYGNDGGEFLSKPSPIYKKLAFIFGIIIVSLAITATLVSLWINDQQKPYEAILPTPFPTLTSETIESSFVGEIMEPNHEIIEEPPDTAVQESTNTPEAQELLEEEPSPVPPPVEIPELGDITIREKDGQIMIYLPAGSFQMGANPADTNTEQDEYPVHEVTLDAFWIDKTEITNKQYQICLNAGACNEAPSAGETASADSFPQVNVTWSDANRYCQWAGGSLPTEAQWEYAARGTDGRIYPWGNTAPACELANFANCVNYQQAVGSNPRGASWAGVLDMAGNVYEWIFDWYDYDYYQDSPSTNPILADATEANVKARRGGSYYHSDQHLRTTNRHSAPPSEANSNTGFRCVVNISD